MLKLDNVNKIYIYLTNNYKLYAVCHILLSSVISLLVALILYPQLLIDHQYSFIRFSDSEIDYYGVFTIVSNFLHGKIQLWDNYDLMPLAYFYLNGGMTSFSNLFTAFVYIIFSPITHLSAEFFHSTYSVVYFFSLILIRSSGFYLLLKRFTDNNKILLFSTVLASTFLAPQTYLGLNNSNIFCFYPLVIHFILRLFETRKFLNFLYAVLAIVVGIGSYPFMGLGYFYLGVHFTIIPIILYFLLAKGLAFKNINISKIFVINKKGFIALLIVMTISALIFMPFVILLKENYKDYDFAHENSRFANLNIFDVSNYFKGETQIADQKQFFYRMINFKDNMWESQWLFLGITALFLTLCGIIFSRDKRKYIFLTTAFLFFLINSPREMFSFSSISHWIVAFTNPFNFTLRTFHMTGALMLPFVLVPLITLGLESLFYIHKDTFKIKYIKILLMVLILAGISINVHSKLPKDVNYYLLLGYAISFLIIFLSFIGFINFRIKSLFIGISIVVLLLLDGYGMRIYFSSYLKKVSIIPQYLPYPKEKVFIDYQNPYILPFREFYTTDDQTYDRYFNKGVYNNQGLYFHYTNYFNYFIPAGSYYPRHAAFKSLAKDYLLQLYLKKDNRLISEAQLAVLDKDGLLAKLLDNNQDRNIILIDRIPDNNTAFSKNLPDNITQYKAGSSLAKSQEILLDFSKTYPVEDKNIDIYEFELPVNFPKYLATGVFTQDISQVKFTVGNKEFFPTQGKLILPFTFDVGNIKSGTLFAALPKLYDLKNQKGSLKYFNFNYNNKLKIIKYEPDNFNFQYIINNNGWLVIHYPYDPHFQITVDGIKSPIYKVNSAFLGISLTKGVHSIYLQYWPDTYLRQAIGLSMFLLFVLPIYLVWKGIKELDLERCLKRP